MHRILRSALVAATITSAAFSQNVPAPAAPLDRSRCERSLLTGLFSDNAGVQRSSALLLGRIRSDRAVIPLMSTLRNSRHEEVRTACAWALCEIGDPCGTYLVRTMASRAESAKLRALCAWYYNERVKPGTFVFRNVPRMASS